jgi:hypothetical protein
MIDVTLSNVNTLRIGAPMPNLRGKLLYFDEVLLWTMV